MYTPYTYLIGWSKLNKWYYGLRTAKKCKCLHDTGCHPDEFWKTYFTSSKIVANLRKTHGEPDVIEIRKTFTDSSSAYRWEHKVITRMKMTRLEKWLNYRAPGPHVGNDEWKLKINQSMKGVPKTHEHRLAMSNSRIGMKFSDKHRENIRKATTGKKQTEESKQKKAKAVSLLKWYNNGIKNVRTSVHPGNEWTEGRIKGFKWKR